MEQRFGFSLDGTNFRGDYATRKDARTAGFNAAREMADPPGVIFVGRIRNLDPQAAAHAKAVIKDMNWRHRDATGDANYLERLSNEQMKDLDETLEQAIVGWLERNKLLLREHRVDAISEYPVPLAGLQIGSGFAIEGFGSQRDVQEMA